LNAPWKSATLTDPSVAPPGKHILSCFVQYAPYKLKDGTWDEKTGHFLGYRTTFFTPEEIWEMATHSTSDGA